jgi:hypothetical protein
MKNSGALFVIAIILAGGIYFLLSSSNNSSIQTQSNSNQSSSSQQPSSPSAPPTKITKYIPPLPASSTPVQSGSCWTSSIAAPFRADAWRCSVGNSISDPCFQIPKSKNLLCGINPAVAQSTSTFVLKLTSSLPPAQTIQGASPNWAWLVELQGGTLCTPFTGTLPFTATGASANYGCAPGPLGDDLLIFGDLNASSSVWTANIGTLSLSTSSLPNVATSSTIPVAEVWQ